MARSGNSRVSGYKWDSLFVVSVSIMLPISLSRFYSRVLHDAQGDCSRVGQRASEKVQRTR